MPRRSVFNVHNILLQMIKQNFELSANSVDGRDRTKNGARKGDGRQHVWEVRHAGLLGIKYAVAVRGDLVTGPNGRDTLRGVVDAAILGFV